MIRLSVDTSFEHLSICLTKNDFPLINYFSFCNRRNSKIIFKVIDDLLKNNGINLSEIDVYIINCGPGSYTGVRIGMSVVKTFALVYKKPIIPINSLDLIASQVKYKKNDYHVLLNCTGREVFYAKYKIVEEQPIAQSIILLTNIEQLIETLKNSPIILFRINPEKRKPEPIFDELKKMKLDFLLPDGLLLDRLGSRKLLKSKLDQNLPVNPLYIKREI